MGANLVQLHREKHTPPDLVVKSQAIDIAERIS